MLRPKKQKMQIIIILLYIEASTIVTDSWIVTIKGNQECIKLKLLMTHSVQLYTDGKMAVATRGIAWGWT